MSTIINGVAIPTDDECRAAPPAPCFDNDLAQFHQALREYAAEQERQRRQAEYVRRWNEQRYPDLVKRSYTVIKDGKEYFFP